MTHSNPFCPSLTPTASTLSLIAVELLLLMTPIAQNNENNQNGDIIRKGLIITVEFLMYSGEKLVLIS